MVSYGFVSFLREQGIITGKIAFFFFLFTKPWYLCIHGNLCHKLEIDNLIDAVMVTKGERGEEEG